jgi:allophanate hydrolase
MTIAALLADYRAGRRSPAQVIADLRSRRDAGAYANAWIHRVDGDALHRRAQELESLASGAAASERLPLYGVPFAVKDNIDVAGLPTTAACPAFSYIAQRSATVVEKLEAAGAIVVGKTNLDQFATGLVGTRSPYGPVSNSFRPECISGGSSSGSAVAVARGEAAFALPDQRTRRGPRVPVARLRIGIRSDRARRADCAGRSRRL